MNWLQRNIPDDLSGDVNLLDDERRWREAVSVPGSLVKHDEEQWVGTVIELRGDPVNGGKVLVEHHMNGQPVQRFYSALALSPAMNIVR